MMNCTMRLLCIDADYCDILLLIPLLVSVLYLNCKFFWGEGIFIKIVYGKLNHSYEFSCRSDGSFVVNELPSGSYVVEISNPNYIFESARVDISRKGMVRARRVNYLQFSDKTSMSYPLDLKDRQKAKYFQTREQWRITDFLMNPMVCVRKSQDNSIAPYF